MAQQSTWGNLKVNPLLAPMFRSLCRHDILTIMRQNYDNTSFCPQTPILCKCRRLWPISLLDWRFPIQTIIKGFLPLSWLKHRPTGSSASVTLHLSNTSDTANCHHSWPHRANNRRYLVSSLNVIKINLKTDTKPHFGHINQQQMSSTPPLTLPHTIV